MSNKKRIVVICPGRGSYTAETLGYLKKYAHTQSAFLSDMDERRREVNEPTLTELDRKEKFSPTLHTRGEHASSLIYACAYCDFMAISPSEYEVVAICGNSMGWYLTLACAGALDWAGAFQVIQTMGSMMKGEIIGGQIIYPIVQENWLPDPLREKAVMNLIDVVNQEGHGHAYLSIWLGGYVVIGGDKSGLSYLLKNLPKTGDYPFQLINHAAFHTPLLYETSRRAHEVIESRIFKKPQIPIIDGRGAIWQPYSTDLDDLYEYTLGHQVYAPYDFTASITTALKEFAPDYLWLLGPGASLGGAIGQILVKNEWRGMTNKDEFKAKAQDFLITAGDSNKRTPS